ncbi:hypothetical protein GCM10023108_42240 [Saccharopolyspora hordei]
MTGQPLGGAPSQPSGTQYQGFGAFTQPPQPPQYPGVVSGFPGPQPPKKSRGPLVAAIALGAVAVIGLVTTVVVLATSGRDEAGPPPPQPTTRSTPTSTATSTAPTTAANADLTPVVPGWQVVRVPKRTALYDVPMDWELDPDPENIHAFGPPDDPVTMTGVADYQVGFCPGDPRSYRATAGATARRGPDDTTVATETLAKFIELAYTRNDVPPVVETGAPENISLPGGIPAVRVTARVTLPNPGPCDSPSVLASVLATNSDGASSVVLLAAADQEVEGAFSAEDLDKLTRSFRADG